MLSLELIPSQYRQLQTVMGSAVVPVGFSVLPDPVRVIFTWRI